MMFRHFTKGDVFLIAGLLFLSAAAFAGIHSVGFAGKHVVVEVDGSRVLELPLDKDVVQSVTGPRGETVIVVENSEVRIDRSECPHHYCERMGSISRRGEIIVCVPNRVVVSIKGGSESDAIDGVTQ